MRRQPQTRRKYLQDIHLIKVSSPKYTEHIQNRRNAQKKKKQLLNLTKRKQISQFKKWAKDMSRPNLTKEDIQMVNKHMKMCSTSHVIQSVQISRSVVSDSLQPHESQHTRPPCPYQLPELTKTLVHRVSDAIQPSHPLLSPSPLAPNPSQHQSLFQ